jgi:hypothetical protein
MTTDADGTFSQRQQAKWILWLVPGDMVASQLLVQARNDDAVSVERQINVLADREIFGLWRRVRTVDLGDLRVAPPPLNDPQKAARAP